MILFYFYSIKLFCVLFTYFDHEYTNRLRYILLIDNANIKQTGLSDLSEATLVGPNITTNYQLYTFTLIYKEIRSGVCSIYFGVSCHKYVLVLLGYIWYSTVILISLNPRL